ncbi:MAG: TrbG/VirB9 family P-type conjugative transfer protein [Pseudomonadota bacterium]|nr:TrbG/VirB9 family P-type conjugative transfer protein [Pseudomonadota bacterium]
MKRLALAALLLCAPVGAQVRPVPSSTDPMHHSVTYAEGQTVILEAAPGFQLTVEFDEGEQIQSAAAGDGASWQVSAPERSSQFFVRPNSGAAPTNLTVITNRRSYYFLLMPAAQMTASTALSVRFNFPGQQASVAKQVEPAAKQSGSYRLKGAAAIRPSLIWDNGEKTFLDWPEGVEVPAIFTIDSAGNESLVNSYHRDGKFVIDAVYSRLLFRLDRQTARADRKAERS